MDKITEELITEIRRAFADYRSSEGCSCCQDIEGHKKAEQKLGELLNPDTYNDGSGFDWYKYTSENSQ